MNTKQEHPVYGQKLASVCLILLLLYPIKARANFIEDLAGVVTYPVRVLVKPFERDIYSGISEEAGNALEKLRDGVIIPALDRINYITEKRIEQLQEASKNVVKEIETAGQQLLNSGERISRQLIEDIYVKLNKIVTNLVVSLKTIICPLFRSGSGLDINFGPLKSNADSIRVWRPMKSECWRTFIADKNRNPVSEIFSGWEHHKGMLCENETSIYSIQINDPDGLSRLAAAYSKLATQAKLAECASKSIADEKWLLLRSMQYEDLAQYYQNLKYK